MQKKYILLFNLGVQKTMTKISRSKLKLILFRFNSFVLQVYLSS